MIFSFREKHKVVWVGAARRFREKVIKQQLDRKIEMD